VEALPLSLEGEGQREGVRDNHTLRQNDTLIPDPSPSREKGVGAILSGMDEWAAQWVAPTSDRRVEGALPDCLRLIPRA
jgi:hypothetical protein